jgi:hypothetical protein
MDRARRFGLRIRRIHEAPMRVPQAMPKKSPPQGGVLRWIS